MDYVRLLFSFKGRLNRARFLVVQLALLACWFVVQFHFPSQPEALYWAIAVPMIWINLATTARRLHDRDRNGWWAVAVFAVNRLCYLYYGLFFGLYFGVDVSMTTELLLVMLAVALSLLQTAVIIELFFLTGTDGANRFGPDPTRTDAHSPVASRTEPAGVPDFLVLRGPALRN